MMVSNHYVDITRTLRDCSMVDAVIDAGCIERYVALRSLQSEKKRLSFEMSPFHSLDILNLHNRNVRKSRGERHLAISSFISRSLRLNSIFKWR